MEKLFGTDGVRGIANKFLTPELTTKIGRAGAFVLAGKLGRPARILVGTDTRLSADMLEAALTAGLCSVGAEVHRAGVVPSPAMAYLVRKYNMDAGVMLSASHNPMPDNGIKFFDAKGLKLADEIENEIETYINGRAVELPRPTAEKVGRALACKNAVQDYCNFLLESVSGKLNGLRIALDCANGATFAAAPQVFKLLGADVSVIHHKPNGININEDCGSTHMESLCSHVRDINADIGLAFDGDGDRVLCVDERGEELDGDYIMAICGLALKNSGKLKNNTIVATIMSNMGFEMFCQKEGIKLLRTKVGDRYVIEEMMKGSYNLGGEQSGHIILLDHNTTGDGILTGLMLAATLKESGQKLSQLSGIMKKLPQVLLGAKYAKRPFVKSERVKAEIEKVIDKLAGSGRVSVRASGTEPIVRVMLEGADTAEIQKYAEELVQLIEAEA